LASFSNNILFSN